MILLREESIIKDRTLADFLSRSPPVHGFNVIKTFKEINVLSKIAMRFIKE